MMSIVRTAELRFAIRRPRTRAPPRSFLVNAPGDADESRRLQQTLSLQNSTKGGKNVIFAASSSCFGWHRRDTVGYRGHVFPQRLPPACPRWKNLRHIDADHGRERGVPRGAETPKQQCRRRRSDVLSGGNRMGDRQAETG